MIEIAIGGQKVTTTIEGRERYPVRVRYLRELRDSPEALKRIFVPAPQGRYFGGKAVCLISGGKKRIER